MSKSSERRIPIIALTAHILERDERRCRAAGMDAFVSKPFDAEQLAVVLESSTDPAAAPSLAPQGALDLTDETPVMRAEAALQRLAGNEKLFSDLVGFFLEDAPMLVSRIANGLHADDADSVQRAAHSLKGLAANFDALRVTAIAGQIEQLAEVSHLSEVKRAAETLPVEVGRLCAALEPFRR